MPECPVSTRYTPGTHVFWQRRGVAKTVAGGTVVSDPRPVHDLQGTSKVLWVHIDSDSDSNAYWIYEHQISTKNCDRDRLCDRASNSLAKANSHLNLALEEIDRAVRALDELSSKRS